MGAAPLKGNFSRSLLNMTNWDASLPFPEPLYVVLELCNRNLV